MRPVSQVKDVDMYDVEITEGLGGSTVEKLGTCTTRAGVYKAIEKWAGAHSEHGPCNPYWRSLYCTDGSTSIDYGSHTHFGKYINRRKVPQE